MTISQTNRIAKIAAVFSAFGLFAMGFSAPTTHAASLAETPTIYTASSTAFTVTTNASLRLLATSTQRVAATIQTYNCAAGANLFMRLGGDFLAVAGTGLTVQASSTERFSQYPNTPVVAGAIQGITNVGSCTVLVTEWDKSF